MCRPICRWNRRPSNSAASTASPVSCAALAARAPVMLIIEDAHWADSATLSLLRHIARRLRRARVLIVATHREADLDETRLFHEWLGDLQREHLATSINLARLDKDHTRDLLAALFQEAITPEFLDGIYQRHGRQPVLYHRSLSGADRRRRGYREGDGWQRLSMAQIQIPHECAAGDSTTCRSTAGGGARYAATRRRARPRVSHSTCCRR